MSTSQNQRTSWWCDHYLFNNLLQKGAPRQLPVCQLPHPLARHQQPGGHDEVQDGPDCLPPRHGGRPDHDRPAVQGGARHRGEHVQLPPTQGLQPDALPAEDVDEEVLHDVQLLHPAPVRDPGPGGGRAAARVWQGGDAEDDAHDEVHLLAPPGLPHGLPGGDSGDGTLLHAPLGRLLQHGLETLEPTGGEQDQGGLRLAGALLQVTYY